MNVKTIETVAGLGELKIELDTELTPELKQEGIKREMVRLINGLRKQMSLNIEDRIIVYWKTENKETEKAIFKYLEEIKNDTLSNEIIEGKNDKVDMAKEVKVNGVEVWLGIKKL